MSTTPTPTPVPVPATSTSWLTNEIIWIKAHESLIIIGIAALLLFKAGQGIENIIIHHDDKAATSATDKVNQDVASNKVLSDQLAAMKATVDAQTAQINTSIANNKDVLVKQQKIDANSTPAQIDTRWQTLLPLTKPGSIIPLTDDSISVTNDTANQTVQALEQIPVLENQVNLLTQEVTLQAKEITNQDTLIQGLNQQIGDEIEKDTADVKLAKAQGKKSFWHGFKIGFIAGAVAVEAVRIWAGKP